MMDNRLTQDLQKWLASEHNDPASVRQGAEILLKLNRNVILYQTVIKNPVKYAAKVEYELKKFLPMRLAGMTMQETVRMENEVMPQVNKAIRDEADNAYNDDCLPAHSGKRADHDTLPETIKAIWQRNADRWKKIKELQAMCVATPEPCERFEFVKQLKELWYAYKADFVVYDEFKPGQADCDTPPSDGAELLKEIDNNKKYIYKNLEELKARKEASLADDADHKTIKRYNSLKTEMTSRATMLLSNKVDISADVLAKLADGGVILND